MRFAQTEHGVFLLIPNNEQERNLLSAFADSIPFGRSIRFSIKPFRDGLALCLTVADSQQHIRVYGETDEDQEVLDILSSSLERFLCFLGVCGEKTLAMNLAFPPDNYLPRRFRRRHSA